MVVRDPKGATVQRLRLVSWRTGSCQAEVRAAMAERRAERAAVRQAGRQAAAARRAIEVTSEASAL
jgi:hypothetical protein